MYRTRLSVHDVQDVQDVQDQAERAQGKQGACTSAFRARTVHRGRLCCQCLQRRRPPWTPSCAVHPHQSLLQHSSSATRRERERERYSARERVREIQRLSSATRISHEREHAWRQDDAPSASCFSSSSCGHIDQCSGKLLLQLVLRHPSGPPGIQSI
jgi:hypothetical protein